MNLGSFAIDDLCTFYVNAHTPSTGAAVDADAVPGYRVYEDETGTPILTGSMALLDDTNTVGFYSEQITLSAANGFEAGKSYCVRITIVVGGVTGIVLRSLQIGAKVDVRMLGGGVQSATDLKDFADDGYDPSVNKVEGVKLADLITAYTGNTVQTGDNFARIGAAGAGLTDLGGMSTTMKAQVQTEADDALVARNLDKLVSVSGTADSGTTTSMVDAARTEADVDYWIGSVIVFTSGAIAGQSRVITNFIAATDTISWDSTIPLSQAVTTETYVILPAGLEKLFHILARLPALVGGRVDASVGAMAANVLTATAIATDAITNAKIAANAIGDAELAADVETMIRTALGLATANLDTQLADIIANLPAAPPKNTAFTYVIKMVDSTDHATPETGLTIAMTRSLDGAAFGAATGTITEISTGHYRVAASAADMNGDVVTHRFTASGADDLTMEFKTVS